MRDARQALGLVDRPDERRRGLLAASPGLLLSVGARSSQAQGTTVFRLGIASGQPRSDRIVLWTRLVGEALPAEVPVRWEIALDEQFRRIAADGVEVALAQWAHTVHAEPSGLAPDRWYWYRFTALGERSVVGRTRTAPAPEQRGHMAFAIASCQRFDTGFYAAWKAMARESLDLVIFLGDYIYEYATREDAVRPVPGGVVSTLDQYRDRYATHKSDLSLQQAHAAFPWLIIWDDHEVDNDYAALQGATLKPDFKAQRAAAYQAWWEHMPLPKSARPSGPDLRMFGHLDWGSLARIHLLDSRQYRDPQVCPRPGMGGSNVVTRSACPALFNPERSLLGAQQERWLAANWTTERSWNLLAQSTLMARMSWGDPKEGPFWTDGWDGYPLARKRLLRTVERRRIPGVVVLGGDVHAHYVADLRSDFDDKGSPVVATEFCGTSISSPGLDQSRIDAAMRTNPHIHHARSDRRGYTAFDLDQNRLRARLMTVADVRDEDSEVSADAQYVVLARNPGAVRA
jgi:alkaline phosphatase D